jgi:putative tryptophan/tyrosine transport system substrate-binding protein
MDRRAFIAGLSGAAVWPAVAHAQRPSSGKLRRLGVLQPGSSPSPLVDAMRARLRELGYSEGREIAYEFRWAEGKLDRLPELATELAGSNVDVITAFSTPAALAAQKATTIIPIVFSGVGDPVGTGLVPSLAHPGRNVTGFSLLATELAAKRLEILQEIVPNMSPIAMFWNDTNPGMVLRAHEAEGAAAKLGVAIRSVGVHDLTSFDAAFAAVEHGRAVALLTLIDPFTREHRQQIVDFAAQRHLPAIYEAREFVDSGGLISYGPSLLAMEQRVAEYVDKIFNGAKAGDLPVEQPTKFELVINLKTARALGLTIPPDILALTDEVIE